MIRRVFLAFLVFGLVACGDDGTGLEDIAGTYTLQTVDGGGLPAVLEETGTTFLLEITAGSVTLNQDMTCSVISMFRVTEFGNVTTETETGVCEVPPVAVPLPMLDPEPLLLPPSWVH